MIPAVINIFFIISEQICYRLKPVWLFIEHRVQKQWRVVHVVLIAQGLYVVYTKSTRITTLGTSSELMPQGGDILNVTLQKDRVEGGFLRVRFYLLEEKDSSSRKKSM